MEVIRRRIEERERVVREAREWALKLSYRVTAILVGSYARGDFNKWSDIDIILITDEIRGNPIERLRKIDSPPGYEIIVWTLDEYKKMLRKKNPLALEALNRGIVLRDDYSITKAASQ